MSEISKFKKLIAKANGEQLFYARQVCYDKIVDCQRQKTDIADLAHDKDPKIVRRYNRLKKKINADQTIWEDLLDQITKRM